MDADTKRDIERPEWETKHTITHAEARQVAERFIAGHFRNAGKEYPRITIPADPERDDDLLLVSYIAQQERAQPSPREVTLEKVLRLLEDERQGYENCSSSGDYYTRGTNIAKEAALHEAIRRVHALSQASDGWEG